jgi:hypothetical protein
MGKYHSSLSMHYCSHYEMVNSKFKRDKMSYYGLIMVLVLPLMKPQKDTILRNIMQLLKVTSDYDLAVHSVIICFSWLAFHIQVSNLMVAWDYQVRNTKVLITLR